MKQDFKAVHFSIRELQDNSLGYKAERCSIPYLKTTSCFICITLISVLYMFGDLVSFGYNENMRRPFNEKGKKTTHFTYINQTEPEHREGFLVWNPICRIPDIDPWHESVKQYVKKVTLPSCGTELSRVQKVGEDHVLIVDDTNMACCYSVIKRFTYPDNTTYIKADDMYSLTRCTEFKHNVTFSKEEQFVKVTCSKKGLFSAKTYSYSNVHSFIKKTEDVKKKLKNTVKRQNHISVMFFGIDSISRMNLFRTMPRTVDYITNQGWINFKGYNKVGDNTLPNVMAILTGYTINQLKSTCWHKIKFDLCPIIWKDFSRKDYITAYAEDIAYLATFNYMKSGFVRTPTDYYLRPMMLAAEKLPYVKKDTLKICMGPKSTVDHIIDYALEFVEAFRNDPFFSLFWTNSFSHQDVNTPSAMDDRFLKFFKDLEKTGALNNTIILFLSDHGMRFGKIRETYIGWLEERLPFLYFWIPEVFKKMHPEKYQSLVTNIDRLTSPYDVHVTLQDLLGTELNGTKACPKCQSLFKDVPWNRSCADAGIPEHWCTCAEYKMLSTESGPVRNIAQFVANHLNLILNEGKSNLVNGTKCATLSIHRIISFRSKVFSKKFGSQEEYVILFETVPGEALFEATVAYQNTFKIMNSVSRINSYAGQSVCIKDSFLQKYCFCQNI